jgi:hypothetical protein
MSGFEPDLHEVVAAGLEKLAADDDAPDTEWLVRVVSAATKLFARGCETAGHELEPVDASVSTTEAVRLSVALARSQNLSPFDLALWFRRDDRRAEFAGES